MADWAALSSLVMAVLENSYFKLHFIRFFNVLINHKFYQFSPGHLTQVYF